MIPRLRVTPKAKQKAKPKEKLKVRLRLMHRYWLSPYRCHRLRQPSIPTLSHQSEGNQEQKQENRSIEHKAFLHHVYLAPTCRHKHFQDNIS